MYIDWAITRLEHMADNDTIIVYDSGKRQFGFTCMNYYSGLMARPGRTGASKGVVKKSHQGLFDIMVETSDRYNSSGVSHRAIMEDLVKYSCPEHCLAVWRDVPPEYVARNNEELEALYTMALLFFEQELNWGNEPWQKFTYFAPKVTMPSRVRPRDMLMGFILQAFELGIDNIAYWQTSRPTTTTFMSPAKINYGYEDYPLEFKRYFTDLEDDIEAKALMTKAGVLLAYREKIKSCSTNPDYIS